MTPKEQMYQIILKAFGEGVGKLIKNGLAFTVMSLTMIGLAMAIYFLSLHHTSEIMDIRKDFSAREAEFDERLNLAESRFYECQNENRILSIRLAELEAIVKYRKSK